MESIGISKFKEYCLRLLDQVGKNNEPIEVTRNGEPLVIIYPANRKKNKAELFGCMRDSGIVVGDIVGPIPLEEQEWDVLR